jgi:hypothetical protein
MRGALLIVRASLLQTLPSLYLLAYIASWAYPS